ncbi:hypothetical protein A2U01_0020141, partial [Trifolium medium]|nr:hypothetical protein [Trifolium medium]
NWRGYTVKKVTDDEDIINSFTRLHGIRLVGDDDDTNYADLVCDLRNDDPLGAVEAVESSNNEEIAVSNPVLTPTSKLAGKQPLIIEDAGTSATKEPTVKRTVNFDEASATKEPTAKRTVNFDRANESISDIPHPSTNMSNEGDVAASKETKLSCVKIEGAK